MTVFSEISRSTRRRKAAPSRLGFELHGLQAGRRLVSGVVHHGADRGEAGHAGHAGGDFWAIDSHRLIQQH